MGETYPTSLQSTIHYLEKHSKSVVCVTFAQEGSSFAQRNGNGNPNTFEKNIGKKGSATSVGINDTLHHTAEPSLTETEIVRRNITTVVRCP